VDLVRLRGEIPAGNHVEDVDVVGQLTSRAKHKSVLPAERASEQHPIFH